MYECVNGDEKTVGRVELFTVETRRSTSPVVVISVRTKKKLVWSVV